MRPSPAEDASRDIEHIYTCNLGLNRLIPISSCSVMIRPDIMTLSLEIHVQPEPLGFHGS